jgi:hypothetical protein
MAAPSRKQFDLVVVMWLLLETAWALPKLWAHRISSRPNSNAAAQLVAGTIESVH